MSATNVDRWFSDPQLDLSFHFEDAASTARVSTGTEAQKQGFRSSAGKRGTFGQQMFADVPMVDHRRLSRAPNLHAQYRRGQAERPWIDERDSRGKVTRPPVPRKEPILPTEPVQAIEIIPDKRRFTLAPRRSPDQRQPAPITIAEFESPSGPLSYKAYTSQTTSYTPQIKPLQTQQPSSTASSRVSSVSTQQSTSSNTTLDYSLFPVPAKDTQYTGYQRGEPQDRRPIQGNPQPHPEQFIQQSARRPINRGVGSPRQASFNTRQKTQKVFRVNSRGSGRRASTRKSQYWPGKPRLVGDMRRMPMSSINAQKIRIVCPSERPDLVGIPPTYKNPASKKSEYPVLQNTTPTELPPPPLIASTTIPFLELAVADSTQESAVTSSPQEIYTGDFAIASPQYKSPDTLPAPKPTTPLPAHTLYRAKIPKTRQEPKSATVQSQPAPASSPVSQPRSQEDLELITSKPLPSIPPLVTGWPSWEQETKEEDTQKKEEVKVIAPPSPTETTWNPAGWREDEVRVLPKNEEVNVIAEKEVKVAAKNEEKEHQVVVKQEEPEKIAHEEKEENAKGAPGVNEIRVNAEQEKLEVKAVEARKMPEIPEVLRIGSRQNTSLFQRLSSLEAMDARSRY